jgi:hypothetical protein
MWKRKLIGLDNAVRSHSSNEYHAKKGTSLRLNSYSETIRGNEKRGERKPISTRAIKKELKKLQGDGTHVAHGLAALAN